MLYLANLAYLPQRDKHQVQILSSSSSTGRSRRGPSRSQSPRGDRDHARYRANSRSRSRSRSPNSRKRKRPRSRSRSPSPSRGSRRYSRSRSPSPKRRSITAPADLADQTPPRGALASREPQHPVPALEFSPSVPPAGSQSYTPIPIPRGILNPSDVLLAPQPTDDPLYEQKKLAATRFWTDLKSLSSSGKKKHRFSSALVGNSSAAAPTEDREAGAVKQPQDMELE